MGDAVIARLILAYSSADRAHARALSRALADAGHTIVVTRDAPPGQSWASFFAQEIQAADALVALWSPTSAKRPHVLTQARIARQRGKLIDVRVDPGELPVDVPMEQLADLSVWNGDPRDRGWMTLIAAINAPTAPEVKASQTAAASASVPTTEATRATTTAPQKPTLRGLQPTPTPRADTRAASEPTRSTPAELQLRSRRKRVRVPAENTASDKSAKTPASKSNLQPKNSDKTSSWASTARPSSLKKTESGPKRGPFERPIGTRPSLEPAPSTAAMDSGLARETGPMPRSIGADPIQTPNASAPSATGAGATAPNFATPEPTTAPHRRKTLRPAREFTPQDTPPVQDIALDGLPAFDDATHESGQAISAQAELETLRDKPAVEADHTSRDTQPAPGDRHVFSPNWPKRPASAAIEEAQGTDLEIEPVRRSDLTNASFQPATLEDPLSSADMSTGTEPADIEQADRGLAASKLNTVNLKTAETIEKTTTRQDAITSAEPDAETEDASHEATEPLKPVISDQRRWDTSLDRAETRFPEAWEIPAGDAYRSETHEDGAYAPKRSSAAKNAVIAAAAFVVIGVSGTLGYFGWVSSTQGGVADRASWEDVQADAVSADRAEAAPTPVAAFVDAGATPRETIDIRATIADTPPVRAATARTSRLEPPSRSSITAMRLSDVAGNIRSQQVTVLEHLQLGLHALTTPSQAPSTAQTPETRGRVAIRAGLAAAAAGDWRGFAQNWRIFGVANNAYWASIDDNAYAAASQSGSDGLRAYLQTFPNGRHASAAREALNRRAAYSLEGLDPRIVDAVQRARAAAAAGEEAAQRSLIAAQRARAAASRAQASAPGHAVRFYTSNERYDGEYAEGRPQGYGVYTISADGGESHFYSGGFENGAREGLGIYAIADGSTTSGAIPAYAGEWSNGGITGRGVMNLGSGASITGDFANGVAQGYGVATSQDGRYEGQWREDSAHGFGVFWDQSGQPQLVGVWADHVLVERF